MRIRSYRDSGDILTSGASDMRGCNCREKIELYGRTGEEEKQHARKIYQFINDI